MWASLAHACGMLLAFCFVSVEFATDGGQVGVAGPLARNYRQLVENVEGSAPGITSGGNIASGVVDVAEVVEIGGLAVAIIKP